MNLYENTFMFYDSVATEFDNDDLTFYESFLQSKKSKILEIGCGTGRVSIWLASRGYSVTGLDLSKYMLSMFIKKLDQNKNLRSNINIVQADMSNFCLNEKFDLIIAPSKSFHAITDIDKAQSTLNCIKKHMSKDSLLILDLFNPQLLSKQNNIVGQEVTLFTSDNLNATYKCVEVDSQNGIIYSETTIKESYMGVCKTYIDHQKLRYYTLQQITELFFNTGLEIVNVYNGYNQFHEKKGLIISSCISKGVQ